MCLVFLVVAGIIAAVAMKLTGVGDDVVNLPGPKDVRLSPLLQLLHFSCNHSSQLIFLFAVHLVMLLMEAVVPAGRCIDALLAIHFQFSYYRQWCSRPFV
jgi:hypothetical protein